MRNKTEEQTDLLDFVVLKERLVARLQQMGRIQKLQIEVLESVEVTARQLSQLQLRHPKWRVAKDNKELLVAAKLWTKLTYNSMTGIGLR